MSKDEKQVNGKIIGCKKEKTRNGLKWLPDYELGREIGVDFPRLRQFDKRFYLTRPRKS